MLIGRLAHGTGVLLCAAILAGTASAGDKPKDEAPGNSGSAPGQQKKADPASAPAATPTPAASPAPAPAPAAAPAAAAAAAKPAPPPAKAAGPDKPRPTKTDAAKEARATQKAARKEAKPRATQGRSAEAKQRGSSQGRSAEAHHHVIVCHRTGSESNPYVVINIPLTAWHEAHSPSTGSHPPLDGRSDILLKDPASRPGSKDGFTKDDCPGATRPAPQPPAQQKGAKGHDHVLICHRTGSASNPYVLINIARPGWENGHSKHKGDVLIRAGVRPGEKGTSADVAVAERSCRTVSSLVVTAGPTAAAAPTVGPKPAEVASASQPAPVTNQPSVTSQPTAAASVAAASVAAPPVPAARATAAPASTPRAEAVAAPAVQPPAAQVAAARPAQAESKRPKSGVLAAVRTVQQTAAETLPFTGIPIWLAVLFAGSLLGAGLVLRHGAARR